MMDESRPAKRRCRETGFDNGWACIQKGIEKLKRILDGIPEEPFTVDEHMNFYTLIYQMGRHTTIDLRRIYFNCAVDDYINSNVMPSLRRLNGELLLVELVRRWDKHQDMMRVLSKWFMSVKDCSAFGSLPSLKELARRSFRDVVCQQLRDQVKDSIVSLIDQDRDGLRMDVPLVKKVMELFAEVGMENFFGYFDDENIGDTAAYYSRKASNWIEPGFFTTYVLMVDKYLKGEMDHSRKTKMASIERRELMAKRPHKLTMNPRFEVMDYGLRDLLKDWKHVASEMRNFDSDVSDEASLIILDFLGAVLHFHQKLTKYIRCAHVLVFGCNFAGFREAFHDIFKKGGTGFCFEDCLALHCDSIIMQVGYGELSEENARRALELAKDFLDYVEDKERFYKVYSVYLSRRVVFHLSCHRLESWAWTMLSGDTPSASWKSVPNVEEMSSDVRLADEIQILYRAHLINKKPVTDSGPSLRVRALRSGMITPTYCQTILPDVMVNCVQIFTVREREGPELDGTNCSASGLVRKTVRGDTFLLLLNHYQAAVLLLFNEKKRLSWKEIKGKLGFKNDIYLRRVLESLSGSRDRILIKEPNTDSYSGDDTFKFNCEFTHPYKDVWIPMPRKE